jgi:hypothetical protein
MTISKNEIEAMMAFRDLEASNDGATLPLARVFMQSYLACDGKAARGQWREDRMAHNVELDRIRYESEGLPFAIAESKFVSALSKPSVWKKVLAIITRFAQPEYRALGYAYTGEDFGRFLNDQSIVNWLQWDKFYRVATAKGKALVEKQAAKAKVVSQTIEGVDGDNAQLIEDAALGLMKIATDAGIDPAQFAIEVAEFVKGYCAGDEKVAVNS